MPEKSKHTAESEQTKIFGRVCLDVTPDFKVGDQMPEGYIARQEWAQVHMDAGLKQESCCSCGLWFFPHQLSEKIIVSYAIKISRKTGPEKVKLEDRICKECDARRTEHAKSEGRTL